MTTETLRAMDQELRDYDVRDGGWVHEDKGPGFNASHVFTELTGSFLKKDYDSLSTARKTAADSIQYALRLSRWFGSSYESLIPSEYSETMRARELAEEIGIKSVSRAAVMKAVEVLQPAVHNLDHDDMSELALSQLYPLAPEAGRLLVFSAYHQSGSLGFNMESAFSARIDELRYRFNVRAKEE